MKFTVFYTKDSYNPYKTYERNANRYAGSKTFDTLPSAQQFAATVKNARIYNSAGYKVA